MNRLQPARVGPGAQEGRHLDLLEGRLPRHRARTRAPRSSSRPAARRAGSGTSRCTTTSSASASWRRSTTCSRAATDYEKTYDEEVEHCPGGEGARVEGDARDRLLRHQGLLVPREAGGRRRLGAGRRRLRLPRPALLVGRAAGAASPGELAADAIVEGLAKGDTSEAQLGKWGAGVQRGHGPHAPAGVRVLRRLQLRPVRQAATRTCTARSPTC